jgi:hypothetical protein
MFSRACREARPDSTVQREPLMCLPSRAIASRSRFVRRCRFRLIPALYFALSTWMERSVVGEPTSLLSTMSLPAECDIAPASDV